jgi:hypothetical protein
VLIVEASPEMTKEQIKDILGQGLKRSQCSCDGEGPTVKEISSSFFRQFDAIYRELDEPHEASPQAASGDVVVSPAPQTSNWEVRLTRPKKYLKAITLTYGNGKKEPLVPGKNRQLKRVGLTKDGGDVYEVSLSGRPQSYELVVGELDKPDQQISGTWPKQDSFFVVAFRNFRGDFNKMQEVLSDSTKVSDPLTRIQEVSDMRFLFANFGETIPPPPPPDNLYELTLRVDRLPGRAVARVWVLFPMTQKDVETVVSELRDLKTGLELSKKIRSQEMIKADKEAVLSSATRPTWTELRSDKEGFLRKFQLADLPKLREQFPRLFYLVVWEFEADKDEPRAIAVSRQGVGKVYVLDGEIDRWPADIASKIQREKNEPATPPKQP